MNSFFSSLGLFLNKLFKIILNIPSLIALYECKKFDVGAMGFYATLFFFEGSP